MTETTIATAAITLAFLAALSLGACTVVADVDTSPGSGSGSGDGTGNGNGTGNGTGNDGGVVQDLLVEFGKCMRLAEWQAVSDGNVNIDLGLELATKILADDNGTLKPCSEAGCHDLGQNGVMMKAISTEMFQAIIANRLYIDDYALIQNNQLVVSTTLQQKGIDSQGQVHPTYTLPGNYQTAIENFFTATLGHLDANDCPAAAQQPQL